MIINMDATHLSVILQVHVDDPSGSGDTVATTTNNVLLKRCGYNMPSQSLRYKSSNLKFHFYADYVYNGRGVEMHYEVDDVKDTGNDAVSGISTRGRCVLALVSTTTSCRHSRLAVLIL